jgi:hypothetical protein
MAMNGQERTKRTNEKGKEDSAAMRLMRLYLDHEDYGNACFFIVLPEFCFPAARLLLECMFLLFIWTSRCVLVLAMCCFWSFYLIIFWILDFGFLREDI